MVASVPNGGVHGVRLVVRSLLAQGIEKGGLIFVARVRSLPPASEPPPAKSPPPRAVSDLAACTTDPGVSFCVP